MGRRRSAEAERFWARVVQEQAESGLSVRAYCKQRGLAEPSFYAWRKKLQHRNPVEQAPAAGANLIAVDVVGGPPAAQLEIESRSGVVIRVREDVSRETLRRVLWAAADPCDQDARTDQRRFPSC